MDGGTGEKTVGAFSTIVEEDDDEFGEFNLATVANHEKVLAGRDDPVPESWILLECQSTCHIVKKRGPLKNIKPCRPVTMHSHAGKSTINHKGMMGTLESYLYEDGIANILSLYQLAKKYRITFDSEGGNCFVVHKGPNDKHETSDMPACKVDMPARKLKIHHFQSRNKKKSNFK